MSKPFLVSTPEKWVGLYPIHLNVEGNPLCGEDSETSRMWPYKAWTQGLFPDERCSKCKGHPDYPMIVLANL